MSLINYAEELLAKALGIVSRLFAISLEPVKLGKIPELDKPEVRKTY
jgi:hypothetical protein